MRHLLTLLCCRDSDALDCQSFRGLLKADPDRRRTSATLPCCCEGVHHRPMAIYNGSCHCGRVRFEVQTDLDCVRACDCSICRRRGALIHRVGEADLKVLTPLAELTTYKFHTQQATDYFCPTCGILPFRRPRTAPHLWAINVRCLEGVDLDSIPVEQVHGSRLP